MPQRPPSILILNRTCPPQFGATGRIACDLALHLRAKGHHVTIVTSAPTPKTDKSKNLTVIRVEGVQKPAGAWEYFKILKRMERAAKKLPRHDAVISMTDPPMLASVGHTIAKSMRAKHIHWAMDIYPDLFNVLGFSMPPLVTKIIHHKIYSAMKSADAIVAISGCVARHLTHKSIPRTHMHTIENWPERALLGTAPTSAFFSDDNPKFRILYAGTIGLAHEFGAILKAAEYFKKHNPEIEFIFVGKGRGLEALAAEVKKRALFNIRFLSHQPTAKVKSLMEGGDLHLVTMKDGAEGLLYPSKFYSACAVARPVIYIGPDGCNIQKIIESHKCGTSVSTNDAQTLIKAVSTYRFDSDTWHTHAQNAYQLTKNSPKNNLKQWDDLIAEL